MRASGAIGLLWLVACGAGCTSPVLRARVAAFRDFRASLPVCGANGSRSVEDALAAGIVPGKPVVARGQPVIACFADEVYAEVRSAHPKTPAYCEETRSAIWVLETAGVPTPTRAYGGRGPRCSLIAPSTSSRFITLLPRPVGLLTCDAEAAAAALAGMTVAVTGTGGPDHSITVDRVCRVDSAAAPPHTSRPPPAQRPSDLDGDNIPDEADQCPVDAERPNGFRDADGCPDQAPAHKRPPGSFLILDKISFARDRSVLPAASLPSLDAIALTLKENSDALVLEVQGHTAAAEHRPERLSEARAAAVRSQLIARGVPGERLVARAYGAQYPLCLQRDEKCFDMNRRVEFVVLERRDVQRVRCDRRNDYRARIAFADARAGLDAVSVPILSAVAAYLKAHPATGPVHIHGHAAFNEADPLAISGARAAAVRDFLIARGIPADRTLSIAEGSGLACGPDRPGCWEGERYVLMWMALPELKDDECPDVGYAQ